MGGLAALTLATLAVGAAFSQRAGGHPAADARARHRPRRLERSACGCTRECVRRRSDARADRRERRVPGCLEARRRSAGSARADRDGGERSRQRASRRRQGIVEREGPVIQKKRGTGPLSAPIANFDGICLPGGAPCAEPSSCSCLPPDTNGAAGQTQYVQMVNTDFAVYSKTGQVLRARDADRRSSGRRRRRVRGAQRGRPGRRLRPVREPLAALAVHRVSRRPARTYGECVAISKTSDATGAYNLYFFDFGTEHVPRLPEHRRVADGYYMSANEFPTGQETSSGAAAIVLERDKMLAGQPARYVWFDESAANPAGRPVHRPAARRRRRHDAAAGRRARTSSPRSTTRRASRRPAPTPASTCASGSFHVDWSNPAELDLRQQRPAELHAAGRAVRAAAVHLRLRRLPAAEGRPAGARRARRPADVPARLPQLRRPRVARAEPHGRRPTALEGIRWYEVRNPANGAPSIYQQGTYAPDDSPTNPLSRWMGSIAMDKQGDIALGYSASGAERLPVDPLHRPRSPAIRSAR